MAALWALLGLAVGPLLNLLIYRLPRLERLIAPLECPHCHTARPFYTVSTILTLMLGERGRCRGCGAPTERLGALVELSTGIGFWLLFLRFGFSPMLLLTSFYLCILVVVFFIDWQHRLILNRVTYPGIVVAVVLTPLLSGLSPAMALLGVAIGGITFGLLYGGGYLIYRQEVLGMGDVKLAMLLGGMTGFPGIVMALLLGSVVGAVAAIAMLVSRRGSARDFMPYGTAMCLGAFATFLLDSSLFW